jgi:hypothetical protein|tara:strand:- start:1915 stop:2376 length:462 start_codon:yes stop_codon:yes gene_type:complete
MSFTQSDQFSIADVTQIAEESLQRNDRFSAVILELNQRILACLVTMVQVDREETSRRFGIRDEHILNLLAGMDPNDILNISPGTNPLAKLEIDLDVLRVFEDKNFSPANALRLSMEHMKNTLLTDIEPLQKTPRRSRHKTTATFSVNHSSNSR